jgi:hypothetical protein
MADKSQTELLNSIRRSMDQKATDQLQSIWAEHDTNEWSEQALEIVHSLLLERLGELPQEDEVRSHSRSSFQHVGSGAEDEPSNISSPQDEESLKKCPFCAEWIRSDAILCRYCGSPIDSAAVAQLRNGGLAETRPTQSADRMQVMSTKRTGSGLVRAATQGGLFTLIRLLSFFVFGFLLLQFKDQPVIVVLGAIAWIALIVFLR